MTSEKLKQANELENQIKGLKSDIYYIERLTSSVSVGCSIYGTAIPHRARRLHGYRIFNQVTIRHLLEVEKQRLELELMTVKKQYESL